MIEHTVVCDRCASVGGADSQSGRKARETVRQAGWYSEGDGDICPDCLRKETDPYD